MAMLETLTLRATNASGTRNDESLLPAVTRSLTYRTNGKTILDDVSLRLAPLSLTVVMGPNGAGKSILLRLLHGLLQPSGGAILWGGKGLDPAIRQRQAMVFQRPVLLRRSVADNILFALRLRGNGTSRDCDRILAAAGLSAQAEQAARSLSGGEQQRLALARALVFQPEVLTAAIESAVLGVRRSGTKIIFVSHDLGQAQRLADDVVFLHRGKLQEHSSAAVFFKSPESDAAGSYLAGDLVL
ncbi:MAG: ATP-binding cassette domain-containing protein [Chromatiales bacterium]